MLPIPNLVPLPTDSAFICRYLFIEMTSLRKGDMVDANCKLGLDCFNFAQEAH